MRECVGNDVLSNCVGNGMWAVGKNGQKVMGVVSVTENIQTYNIETLYALQNGTRAT